MCPNKIETEASSLGHYFDGWLDATFDSFALHFVLYHLDKSTTFPSGVCTSHRVLPSNAVNASVKITDMNGRVIKNIAVTANGKGQLVLQAGLLTTGTYQYALIVNGRQIDTKRMVLIK